MPTVNQKRTGQEVAGAARAQSFLSGTASISLILLLLFALAGGVGWAVSAGYAAYRRARAHEEALPQENMGLIVQALRTFYARHGRFPDSFHELDEKLWDNRRRSQISTDGRALTTPRSHYYYSYLRPSPQRAVVWGVPLGARREEAATHLWYISPHAEERWMGPPLDVHNAAITSRVPTVEELHALEMVEQRPDAPPPPEARNVMSFLFGR